LGIASDDRVILFFGAIRPYKGLDTLLEAFASIVRSEPKACLLIVGKLWESWDRYQAIVDRYGLSARVTTRLEYVPTSEVNTYFAAADVVALPYRRFAAQSGVALAAIGCHKPIVATTVGGLEELLAHPRCRVEPDDPRQLAEKLVDLLADQTTLDELQRHSRELAHEFEWSSIVDRLLGHYRELLFAQTPTDSSEDSDHRSRPSLHAMCETSEGGLPRW
jgi:glycosyltransferase involved in cell wall biosynthesis